jgi:hypothetical protein
MRKEVFVLEKKFVLREEPLPAKAEDDVDVHGREEHEAFWNNFSANMKARNAEIFIN